MATKKRRDSCLDPIYYTHEQREEATRETPLFAGLTLPGEEFYRTQTKRLSRIAAKIGVPTGQIEDVVQEVWLDAVKHQDGFQGEHAQQRLAAWLVLVVHNKSIDALRCVERQHAEPLDAQSSEPVDREATEPIDLMAAKERGAKLAKLATELREENPLNFCLAWERVVEDRSIRDLAGETGLGCHAVSCRIDRILKKLQARLGELLSNGS